jgi:hypothetical protein
LNSLDKKIEDKYKGIVGVIRTTINKERELTPSEKTMFMNMAMTMAKDMNLDQQIFKGLLGQIKNQKCQDGIMNIMRNMPKSHFAAAANECRKCRQHYIDNGEHDTEKCNVDGCKDLVILSQCKHRLCHSCFVQLKNLDTYLFDCPCGKANVGELKIYDRSNIESNVSQLSVMFVFILFVIVYALVEGPIKNNWVDKLYNFTRGNPLKIFCNFFTFSLFHSFSHFFARAICASSSTTRSRAASRNRGCTDLSKNSCSTLRHAISVL